MATFTPARLQAVKQIPSGRGWLYEPKFDGYRGLLATSEAGKGSVWSRNNKDLEHQLHEPVVWAEFGIRKGGQLWSLPDHEHGRALADRIDMVLKDLADRMEQEQGRNR